MNTPGAIAPGRERGDQRGRRSRALVVGLSLVLVLLPGARAPGSGPEAAPLAAPLGTGITYQGLLKQNGVPANGTFPMQFQLFDAATGGAQVGPTLTQGVVVTNGQFTVPLDFGPHAFNGEARWLAITVQGTLLSPRQEVRAAPYALALGGLRTEPNATSPNVIGGFSGNSVTAGVVGATAGPYLKPGGTAWNAGSHSSLKTDFAAVDRQAVLEGLAGLPLTTWRLRDGDPAVRHLGPMAEDFYAARLVALEQAGAAGEAP